GHSKERNSAQANTAAKGQKMGQETKTRISASRIHSGASDCTETSCSKCDAFHCCVCGDAAKDRCSYASAGRERVEPSSSSSRTGTVCSQRNASASSACAGCSC